MMKRLTAIFLVQTALLFLTDNLYAQNSRSSHSINSNWAFYKGELQLPVNPGSVAWDTVSIPHSWNSEDVMDDTKGYYRGPAWYLKRISVSESRQDKRAYLEFKGANQKTDVYVNGHRAGSHVGGYTAFTVDISEFLRYGEENEILIKVNNRFNPDIPTLTADFTFFGGIYRDLFLTFTGAVHFSMDSYGSSGVKVITPKVSAAEADIEIKGDFFNQSAHTRKVKVVSYIQDADKQTIARVTTSHKARPGQRVPFVNEIKGFSSPRLWSIDCPYLYTVVTRIMQDSDGFIWVATEDGINKFNGYDFHVYKPEATNGLSSVQSEVHALLEDIQENIWVGGASGLKLLDKRNETFISLEEYPNASFITNAYISSLLEDRDGNIWIGSFEGLSFYDREKKQFSHHAPVTKNGPPNIKIRSLYLDSENIIWIGYDNELKRFDPECKEFLPLPGSLQENQFLRYNSIRRISQDSKGNYWFGSENNGLFFYNVAADTSKNYVHDKSSNSLPSNIIRDVFHASNGEVWIGTREGLSIFNIENNNFTNYRYNKYAPEGLTHNSIWRIIRDKAGSIWLGTYAGGLNVFHPANKKFSHIREQIGNNIGVNHRVISSVVQDENGALWIGTEGGGLNYIHRQTGQYTYHTVANTQGGLVSNNIKALEEDGQGNLWIGTYDGLSFYSRKEKSFEKVYPYLNEPTPTKQIYSLAPDGANLWIGTNGAGLLYIDAGRNLTRMEYSSTEEGTISSNYVSSLLNADSVHLWVGTHRGLNLYDKQKQVFTSFFHDLANPYSISNNFVLSLFQDSRQWIWIGTDGGGLNILDPETQKFYLISKQDGLSNNVVHAVREDNDGNLWVSTNKGLSKITLESSGLPLKPEDFRISNYTVADGLQSNQFLTGSAEKGLNGELFFGGINGITSFFPDQITQNPVPPQVVLTDFLIHNKEINFKEAGSPLEKPIIETKHITLTYEQAYITFRYAALNFINPDKNQYAFRLKGFVNNDQWNYVGDQRAATFTNLEAGDYTFQVKAANNDGLWNENPSQMHLTVLPPYWQTWWAYCIYGVSIALLLFAFYFFSRRNEQLKNRLLFEHMTHEKEQELNKKKLRFFTNISHEIKTPLTLILAPLEKLIRKNEGNNKISNQLMLMQRNGERLIRLINQLLDFRKFESGNVRLASAQGDIVKFTREVFIAFEVYVHQKHLEMQFFAEKEKVMVWFDRDKMEKVLYNLLSNAIKFTPEGGQISVNIKVSEEEGDRSPAAGKQYVLMEVVDNGPGISPENIDKIFERYNHIDESNSNLYGTGIGLAFTKGLVELHKGEITVTSRRPVNGKSGHTCFTVKLPLGREHLSEQEIIADFKNSENIEGYRGQRFPDVFAIQKKKKKIPQSSRPVMVIVEDNVEVRQFIAESFSEDFEIHQAADGQKGLEVAGEIIPDIIISDVMMPRMSGIDFCREVKTDPRTSHIPVILLTARTPLIFKLEGLEIGADDYITKPFNLHFLEARVWNLLNSRQKLKERYRLEFFLTPKDLALNSPDEIFLEKTIKFIEDNIGEPTLNVEELGREIGMSRITLYRKIKGLTNLTVVEFIRSFRLKRAAQLLAQNNLQVNEVAYMVGFQDVDYFRKCFKEQFGHTPSEFPGKKTSNIPDM